MRPMVKVPRVQRIQLNFIDIAFHEFDPSRRTLPSYMRSRYDSQELDHY